MSLHGFAHRRFDARVVQMTSSEALPLEELVARIGRGGASMVVVLREPELSASAMIDKGQVLREATRGAGARLLVADRLDVACTLEADGVHLGRLSVSVREARRLLGEALVTRSAHDDDELARAVDEGADAVLLSPIFASPGKGQPLGLAALTRARERLPKAMALVALGGVTAARVRACAGAGADAVASIRADLSSCASDFESEMEETR